MDQLTSHKMTKTTRREASCVDTHTIVRPGLSELFITAGSQNGHPYGIFADALRAVKDNDAAVVSQHVFAPVGTNQAGIGALADACGECDWPVTWIDSGHKQGSNLAGTQIYAIVGADVERVRDDDRVVASIFEDSDAKYCHLGDLRTSDTSESRPDQARRTFDMMESVLDKAGMDFSRVIRTWIYLDDLLDWYGPFNEVRTDFFKKRGVFDRLVPASTGISGANPYGAAMMSSVLAVAPANEEFEVAAVASPLQCPAPAYGSSFSRAVEFGTPGCRRLSVSGTASIAPDGETAHLDDINAQIDLTFKVVEAILETCGMDWSNAARAMAYLKEAKYAPSFDKYCQANGVQEIPFVVTENHVCRHDLLFEMELDAVKIDSAQT